MTDADRLLDTADTETERLLLRAGRSGAPSRARERALLAATSVLAASSLAAGGAAAGNAALGAKAGSLAALGSLKWLAVVGVVGVGAAASAIVVRHATSASKSLVVQATPAPAHAASAPPPRPARAIPLAEPEPPPAPTASTAAATAREPRGPSTFVPVPSSNPSFADELSALDGARGAIDVGDPARALSILERYRARFPNGSMRPEATILRIEALERAGDHAAAVRTAEAFLTSSPESPYAARVRSLVGGRIDDRRAEPQPLIP